MFLENIPGFPPGPQGSHGDTPQKNLFKWIKKTLLYDQENLFNQTHIFRCFFVLFLFFDVKLIANKRGAPEAPPIHYPINFTSKK